jgi:hypothetical protein
MGKSEGSDSSALEETPRTQPQPMAAGSAEHQTRRSEECYKRVIRPRKNGFRCLFVVAARLEHSTRRKDSRQIEWNQIFSKRIRTIREEKGRNINSLLWDVGCDEFGFVLIAIIRNQGEDDKTVSGDI